MRTTSFECYDPAAEALISILWDGGYCAYYVGGCVRDALLGHTPHDFDIATNALPEQTCALFTEHGFSVLPTGLRHGTVSVLVDHVPYEITTFRSDGVYGDGRRPDSVSFVDSLRTDLARRDFTVNALAYHKTTGVRDFFGGLADLEHRVIRCVGKPEERFQEDALRILRALRFAAVLGFTIEPDTAAAVHACAARIKAVSAERICSEFSRILLSENPSRMIREYIDVFGIFLPELLPCVGFSQNSPWHIYDVFSHTLEALSHTPPDLTLRLAVLFHDIGKPSVYTEDANGVGHFKGHAAVSASLAQAILKRLRFDGRTQHDVCLLIRHHDDRFPANRVSVKKLIRRMGRENALRVVQTELADNAAQNPAAVAARRPELYAMEALVRELSAEEEACFTRAELAVNGRDLLNAGVPEGAQIGALLNRLLDAVIQEELPNEREALLKFVVEALSGS